MTPDLPAYDPRPSRIRPFAWMRLHGALAITLAVCLLSASPARAQSSATEYARGAKRAFDAGDYDRAADLLMKAYDLEPAPPLLFNLGRAYLQAGRIELALGAYSKYLAASPNASDRPAVEGTIRELKARIAKDAATQAALAREAERARRDAEIRRAPAPEPEPAPKPKSALPWITIGVGSAVTAASLPLWLVGSSAHSAAQQAPDVATSDAEFSRARDFATATSVTLIVGGLLVASGVVWAILDTRSIRPRPSTSAAWAQGAPF